MPSRRTPKSTWRVWRHCLLLGTLMLLLLAWLFYGSRRTAGGDQVGRGWMTTLLDLGQHGSSATGLQLVENSASAIEQRNLLSLALNRLQERYQKLVCQVQKQKATSETGGWCSIAVNSTNEHMTDERLAVGLSSLFTGQTVVSLGDGRGRYRQLLLQYGAVAKYDAFDGSPDINQITGGQVRFLDLTLPQYWLPVYDWVLSLEVLEHIPSRCESTVLDNIARVAGVGVVLSWAVPGQGGFYHINNRPPRYMDRAMTLRNFTRDSEATSRLRAAAVLPWFRGNVNVYRRRTHNTPAPV